MDDILNDEHVREFLFGLVTNVRIPGGGWMMTCRLEDPDGEEVFDCEPIVYFAPDAYILDSHGNPESVSGHTNDYLVWHPSQIHGNFRMDHEKAIHIIREERRAANQPTTTPTTNSPPDMVS